MRLPALVAAAWLAAAPASADQAERPLKPGELIKQIGIDQRLDAQVPLDLKFRDETGREVQLGDYFTDKPVILTLVYYRCPMLCTQVLNGLLESSQGVKFQMNKDYQVVSVSIDPHETPEMAAAKKERYARSYRREGAREGWHFLTGDQESIEKLAKVVGYRYRYDPATDQYAHGSAIMLLTPKGRVSRYFYGIDYAPNDLRLGLVEASENRIGSAVDQILLLCYHYDPATGKYGFVIAGALRIAGIVTLLVLGAFLWRMFLLERRRSAEVRQAGGPSDSSPTVGTDPSEPPLGTAST
jgi:protein SCO1/2